MIDCRNVRWSWGAFSVCDVPRRQAFRSNHSLFSALRVQYVNAHRVTI